MRHLLSIEDLDRAGIERILDRARRSPRSPSARSRRCPALRGRRVLNLFYEASTRTRSIVRAGRQVAQRRGHQLRLRRLERREGRVAQGHGADAVGLPARPDRHPHAARRRRRAGRRLDDGRASSTPATASTSTRRRRCSTSTRCASGSARSTALTSGSSATSLHSRVARSNILAFTKLGAEVTVCGPPTLIPRGMEALGCEVEYTLDRLPEADVVYALRMQQRAHDRLLRALAARVRRAATRSTGAGWRRARCSCTPARSTAASSSRPR